MNDKCKLMSYSIEAQRKDVSYHLYYIMFHDQAQSLAAFNGEKIVENVAWPLQDTGDNVLALLHS